MKEKRPKAIPLFQIRLIFKNFDENNSELLNLLFKLITYIFEVRSNIKIKKIFGINKFTNLSIGLKETIKWFETNHQKFKSDIYNI